MRNKDGKAGVAILILAIIILLAAVPWYFLIVGNLNSGGINLFRPKETEEPAESVPDPSDNDPDDQEDEPETPPEEDGPEHGPGHSLPHEDTVIYMRTANQEVFNELAEFAEELNAAAVSLVLFDGDTGEYYPFEYGYADLDDNRSVNINTKFRVASLAKLTTAISAMVLVDEGLLDLDTDISVYLGYEVKNTNFPGTAITARMLMQHTSSIFDSGAFQVSRDRNTSESVRFLLERGSSFRRNEPGSNFEYSNFGYAILGAICENVSGETLDTLSREVLFDPLGIDAAYVPENLTDNNNIAVIYNENHVVTRSVASQLSVTESGILGDDLHLAQGNLTISALDYARVLTMLGNGGVLHGVRVLSTNSVREIFDSTVEGDGYTQGLATRYSPDGFIPGEGFFWHTGSGFGLLAQYLYSAEPGVNRGVVVVTTGVTSNREPSGMVSICNDLSKIAWGLWDKMGIGTDENRDTEDENND